MCISALTGLNKLRFLMMRERATGMYSPGCWVAAHLVYDLLFLRIVRELPNFRSLSPIAYLNAVFHFAQRLHS